jgi:hypothetical protein
MCPPPRSLALEANGCFMVRSHAGLTEYKVAVRSVAPERETPLGSESEASFADYWPCKAAVTAPISDSARAR